MTLDASGNLMVGTTSTSSASSVYKSIDVQGQLVGQVTVSANDTVGPYGGPVTALMSADTYADIVSIAVTTNHPLTFSTNNTERMRLDASGNLGIGVSSPTVPLEVQSNSGATGIIIRGRATANSGTLRFYANNGTTQQAKFEANDSVVEIGSLTNVPLLLYANNAERARITSGGDLLVAKTAASDSTLGVEIQAAGTVVSTRSGSTNSQSTLIVYSTGATAYRFYVGMDGTVNATNTTISAVSDQRLKENIQDLDVGLNKIMALKPRKFDWKAGKGKDIKGDRGWIAQEFEQVFPDMIDTWKDPAPEGEEPYKSVRADLIPVLVKAIQELTARVAQLESK
jgi:hypothetical protein